MRTGKGRSRLLIGIVVSLLAHALLLLAPRRPPPAAPPRNFIELELLVADAAPPAELEAEARAEVEAGAPDAPTPLPRRELPPALPQTPVPSQPLREEPPIEAAPDEEVVQRREEDGVWRDEALPKLDLVYRPKLAPEPEGETEGDSEASEGQRIADRIEGYFRDKRAEEHARSRAEPAIVELRQRLDRKFSVPMEVLDEAPRSPTLGLDGAVRAYLSQAQRYGETGNPYEEDFFAPGAPGALDTVAANVHRFERADAYFGPPISSTTATLTTLVARIEVVPLGEGAEVRLLEGSGVSRFDRLALEQVRKEVERMAFPADVRRMRWAFISSLRVTPPSAVVGCSFDQAFIPQECFYPGSKHQRSRVIVEAIYTD